MRTSEGLGTAFTIEHNERQYLVTAKHVLPDARGPNVVDLEGPETHEQLSVEALPGVPDDVDVAVIPLAEPLTEQLPVVPSSDGMILGQDCYFMGYPYGLGLGAVDRPELAFVKKAIVSASTRSRSGVMLWYLDGHNNPGFSGGPVVYYNAAKGTQETRIAGVVSGYRIHHDEVEINGRLVPGAVVRANSGIVITTDIAQAIAAIDATS